MSLARSVSHPLLLLLPALVACGGDKADEDDTAGLTEESADPAEGIWLLRAQFNDDDSCTEAFDHNFEDSYPLDEGPWTETDILDYSDSLAFVQISVASDSSAVLVSGTQVWPGEPSGDGWVFSWTATDSEQSSKEHEEGYVFQEFVERSDVSSLQLTVSGDQATGTWTFSSDEDITWKESDTWDSDVGLAVGDIPSTEYLQYDDGDAEGLSRVNTAEEAECSGALCEISTTGSCSGTATITLERTGYDEESAYDQLEGVSHPFGTGS